MLIPPIIVVRKVRIVVALVAWRGLHLSIILILSKAHNLKPLFCLITYPIFKKIKHIIVSYFIFHYVTINSLLAGRTSYIRSSFTSHYVSINSQFLPPNERLRKLFTSHYVSINSILMRNVLLICFNLHPTMYLLILFTSCYYSNTIIFTSHYVSINSRRDSSSYSVTRKFTSHYVSINSPTCLNLTFFQLLFTSHYVSINSRNY